MMEMAMDLIAMQLDEAIISKVDGRRNWVIRVENRDGKRVITYKGGYGEAVRWGEMSCLLREIGEKKIRWYTFTYKKDYIEALKTLDNLDIKYYWN